MKTVHVKLHGVAVSAVSLPVVQVEEDTEELRTTFRGEEEAERRHGTSSRSRTQRRTFHSGWEETQQKFLTAQEQGNSFIRTVAMVTRLSGCHICL